MLSGAICPYISRQRAVMLVHEWNENLGVYGRFEMIINDVAFGKYRLFRTEGNRWFSFHPAALLRCSNVGLVHAPGAEAVTLRPTHSFLELGRVTLHPAEDR